MKIRPLNDKVIVRRLEEEKSTSSGIIIPDSATEKPSKGQVIAVGNGKKNDNGDIIAMDVKVGDNILFTQYSGSEINYEGEKLLVMREEDITAIIE